MAERELQESPQGIPRIWDVHDLISYAKCWWMYIILSRLWNWRYSKSSRPFSRFVQQQYCMFAPAVSITCVVYLRSSDSSRPTKHWTLHLMVNNATAVLWPIIKLPSAACRLYRTHCSSGSGIVIVCLSFPFSLFSPMQTFPFFFLPSFSPHF